MSVSMLYSRKRGAVLLFFLQIFSHIFSYSFPLARAGEMTVSLLETPSRVIVSPSSANVANGGTQQLLAQAIFDREDPMADVTVDITHDPLTSWSSSNFSLVTVDGDGFATAVSDGTAVITATYGGMTGFAEISSPLIVANSGGFSRLTSNEDRPLSPPQNPENTPQPGKEETSNDLSPLYPFEVPSGPPAPGEEKFSPSIEGELPPGTSEEFFSNRENVTPIRPAFLSDTTSLSSEEVVQEFLVGKELAPRFLPPELTVGRGELMKYIFDNLEVEQNHKELLDRCYRNLEECLSIFLSVTQYKEVSLGSSQKDVKMEQAFIPKVLKTFAPSAKASFDTLQLYPDVPPEDPYARLINMGTLLSLINGYYEEPTSPFKPYQVISRIEALKVTLGSVGLMKWMYYDELETLLGGTSAVKSQTTAFTDIVPERDAMWWYPRYVNKACEIKMIDCENGTAFRPDDYVTEK